MSTEFAVHYSTDQCLQIVIRDQNLLSTVSFRNKVSSLGC